MIARYSLLFLATFLLLTSAWGSEAISWLPPDTGIVLKLGAESAASEEGRAFRRMMGFVTGTEELVGAFGEALDQTPSEVIVGQWRRNGVTHRAAVVAGGFDPRETGKGFVIAQVAPEVAVLGSPQAVAQCLATEGRSALLAELQHSIEGRSPQPSVGWSWTRGDWFLSDSTTVPAWPAWTLQGSLDDLRSSTLEASAANGQIRVRILANISDAASARFLAAELKEHLEVVGPGDESPMQAFLNQSLVGWEGPRVSLNLELSGEVLQALAASQNARRLFRWELSGALREQREQVSELAELLQIGEGSRVADIGSGRGFLTVRLARLVGESGRAFAVDISQPALDAIRGRLDADLYPQLETVLGEEASPKLAAGSLDAAIIINAYHEMPKHEEMLEAIRNALRPGGRLLLLEPYSLETVEEPREEQVKVHNLSPALVESELEGAGFEIVRRIDEFVKPEDASAPQRNGLVLAMSPQQ